MLSTALHLLLSSLDEVVYTSVTIELGIHRHRFHQHAHRTVCALVGTPVMYRVEQHLLFVIVFCQQIGVGGCEDGTAEDAVCLAEGIHPILVHHHGPCQDGVHKLLVIAVGQQR